MHLTTQFYGSRKTMEKRFRNIFTRVRKQNGMPVLSAAVVLTLAAGVLVSCGVKDAGAGGKTEAAVERAGGGNAQTTEVTSDDTRIQTFSAEDVTAVPAVQPYELEEAKELGIVQELRGVLPGAAEGIWYTVFADGVEYYYGAYDGGDADYYGFAIFSDRYALQNGIAVGMLMEEALKEYPNLAVVDFEGNVLDRGITGHQGWNGAAFPRSMEGMDAEWSYGGKNYSWSDQFDCVMLAEIDTGAGDELPMYAAFPVKDGRIAAITFYHPTAG